MFSGIGPADHLVSHGIPVRMDLAGVGARMYDHSNVPLQHGILGKRLSMARNQRSDRAARLTLPYHFRRSGPGSGPFWSVARFHALRNCRSPGTGSVFTPRVAGEEGAGGGWNIQALVHPGRSILARGKMARPGFQFDVNLLRPESYGTVRLNSGGPMKMLQWTRAI